MSFYHSSIKVFANVRIHNYDGIKNRKTNRNDNNNNDNDDATWSPRWITVEVRMVIIYYMW